MALSLWLIVVIASGSGVLLLCAAWWWRKRRRRVAFADTGQTSYASFGSKDDETGGVYAVPWTGVNGHRQHTPDGDTGPHSVLSHVTDYTDGAGSIRYDSGESSDDEEQVRAMGREQREARMLRTQKNQSRAHKSKYVSSGLRVSHRSAAAGEDSDEDSALHPALHVKVQETAGSGGRGSGGGIKRSGIVGGKSGVVVQSPTHGQGQGQEQMQLTPRRRSLKLARRGSAASASHTEFTDDGGSERYSSEEDRGSHSLDADDSDDDVHSAYYTPSPLDDTKGQQQHRARQNSH